MTAPAQGNGVVVHPAGLTQCGPGACDGLRLRGHELFDVGAIVPPSPIDPHVPAS